MSEQFDTYLLGPHTFEVTAGHGLFASPGVRTFVFSRTLRQGDYHNVTIIGENWKEVVQSLREESGKDIWLFGGGAAERIRYGRPRGTQLSISAITSSIVR